LLEINSAPRICVLVTLAILLLVSTGSCGAVGDNETFLLKQGFTGRVVILFNQKDGQPARYEGRRRVYEIPADGILRTQFDFNHGWHDHGEYYYFENGHSVEVPFVLESRNLNSNTIQACCVSSGRSAKTAEDSWVVFMQFYVGTSAQIDDAFKKAEKVNPADLIQR
jgi:hypothetical protein